MLRLLLSYLLYGWIILLVAIPLNFAAKALGIQTWYDYLGFMGQLGFIKATLSLQALDYLFLFIFYPGIFGLVVYLLKRS